jgi:hypothetical protein
MFNKKFINIKKRCVDWSNNNNVTIIIIIIIIIINILLHNTVRTWRPPLWSSRQGSWLQI